VKRQTGRSGLLVALAFAGIANREAAAAPGWLSDARAVLAATPPAGLTRVRATIRPLLSVLGGNGGAIADLAVDHQFAQLPLRLSLELSPLALAIEADGPGSVGHLRLGAAFSSELVELGLGAGSRIQNYGGNGLSLAAFLRLGTVDGLKFTLTYDDVLRRNQWSGVIRFGLSNVIATLDLPISMRVRLFAEGGASADRWIFASAGLRHRLTGDGGAGTWIVSGSFGFAWVVDRPSCAYPDTGWCTEAAWAAGPTLGFGLERRF
jgi:hypothetical protein